MPATATLDPLLHLGLVHRQAHRFLSRLPPSWEYDDLVAAGVCGLLQALARYDPERGYALSTYAVPAIRGAMLDALYPHRTRVRAAVTVCSLDVLATELRALPAALTVAAEQDVAVLRRERIALVRAAVAALPPRERRLIELLTYQHQNQRQAAHILGLSQGRVSYLRRRALTRLAAQLTAQGITDAG